MLIAYLKYGINIDGIIDIVINSLIKLSFFIYTKPKYKLTQLAIINNK